MKRRGMGTPAAPLCRRIPDWQRIGAFASLALGLGLESPDFAQAADASSANYRHRAGAFGAILVGPLPSGASPADFVSSAVSLGESPIAEPSGSQGSLRSLLPGFLWIAAGRSDALDLDQDGSAFFLDVDDDGDGLLDVHETGTGRFVSAQNTGTSPTRSDSDGDGFADGVEISAGTDPNDPGSRPGAAAVPVSSDLMRLALLISLVVAGLGFLHPRRWRST